MSNAELNSTTNDDTIHDQTNNNIDISEKTHDNNNNHSEGDETKITAVKKEWSEEEEEEEEEEYRGNSSSTTTVTTAATSNGGHDEKQNQSGDDQDEFGEFDEDFATPIDADDDDFGDFGDFNDFQETTTDLKLSNDDDFDDFNTAINNNISADPPPPTEAEEYVKALEAATQPASEYVQEFFQRLWTKDVLPSNEPMVSSPDPIENKSISDGGILCTQCSYDLWDKLSRDSVFYNPITGAIGQFQWTRSESNRGYLNALGVTINYEEKLSPGSSPNSPLGGNKRPQSNYIDTKSARSVGGVTVMGPASAAIAEDGSLSSDSKRNSSPNHHARSNSLSGIGISTGRDGTDKKQIVEQEPELDIDIAKAYCELTEETIRIFPDEKLKSMVVELTRLQRQASEYLGYLLDQREQLMMDAETYNDLISCIVGHAQRLREQNVSKDASPAMVSKKKKAGGGLNMLRRKQNSASQAAFSTSMGGGVVGVKQGGNNPAITTSTAPNGVNGQKKPIVTGTAEGRRSM